LNQHIGPRPDLEAAFAILSAPPSIFVSPLFLDTTLNEGSMAEFDVWLHNRNPGAGYDFSVDGNDSLARAAIGDWLSASPGAGTISPLDSFMLDVTVDASVIIDKVEAYKGVLEVNWGPSGGSLDSLTLVPVFLTVPCFDTAYTSLNSNDVGGPAYNWISAKTLGTKVNNASYYNTAPSPLDDGTTGPHAIGFNFPFFDSSYNQVYIGVNGALSFTDNHVNFGGYYGYLNFPNQDFETIVSAFWNDLIFDVGLVPTSGLFIYRSPTNDTMVIEWYRPANFNLFGDTLTNFEIILTIEGNIKFQFLEVGNGGLNQTAAIGVSAVECAARNHYSNELPAPNQVTDSHAVRFKSNIWDYVLAGDCNNDGLVNILDLTFTVDYIFRGGPGPIPFGIGDANCDGTSMQILDLTYLVDRFFRNGPPTCKFILRH
ncbi:MAG: hypothetical protein ACREBV_03825, partial [Candidatus Zixiibacteriota bacterium]